MEKPYVLHMFTPMPQVSPFDVNMAYDAGYNAVVPYTGLTLDQVTALTQDAIFSRGPKGAKRTGIFIGGRDNGLAADMLDAARRAMVPPFAVSVFADPSGAFSAGIWESTPGKWPVDYTEDEFCLLLAGTVELIDARGRSARFKAGDAFVIASGFKGTWETVDPVKKLYAVYEKPKG